MNDELIMIETIDFGVQVGQLCLVLPIHVANLSQVINTELSTYKYHITAKGMRYFRVACMNSKSNS